MSDTSTKDPSPRERDGDRTRDPHLGKVVLHRSATRAFTMKVCVVFKQHGYYNTDLLTCQHIWKMNFFTEICCLIDYFLLPAAQTAASLLTRI